VRDSSDRKFFPAVAATSLFAENKSIHFDPHEEDNYVDIYQERNIPRLISREGPGAAVGDVNGDGLDDIFIGGASSHAASLYVQGKKGFYKTNEALWIQEKEPEDVAAVFFDADGDKDLDLLVGSGGNNRPTLSKPMSHRLYINDGKGLFRKKENAFPLAVGNTNVMLTIDIDADGDLDVFTASCSVPVQYGTMPKPAFYRNSGNAGFILDESILAEVKPGMITSALFAELDGKGLPELILVGEWMEPAIYSFVNGQFTPTRKQNGLYKGWWHSVAAADLDQDGDLDLVLGNNGANNYLRPSQAAPVKMWVNQFDESAVRQVIISRTVNGKDVPVFLKKELTDQIPSLNKQNLRHEAYAEKSVQQLFSSELISSSEVQTYNYSSSCIAWNNGDGSFEFKPLPMEVQLSAVTSILPADVNGDGRVDLIFGFNLYEWLPQFSRMDAGYGLLLLNDGKKQFSPLAPSVSGIEVVGETRDIKSLLINGKLNYLFIQNNDRPILYQSNHRK
jgi:hypothetical protein